MPETAAPTDAAVRVTRIAICGTDLHVLKGDVPSCSPGRNPGHEGKKDLSRMVPGADPATCLASRGINAIVPASAR